MNSLLSRIPYAIFLFLFNDVLFMRLSSINFMSAVGHFTLYLAISHLSFYLFHRYQVRKATESFALFSLAGLMIANTLYPFESYISFPLSWVTVALGGLSLGASMAFGTWVMGFKLSKKMKVLALLYAGLVGILIGFWWSELELTQVLAYLSLVLILSLVSFLLTGRYNQVAHRPSNLSVIVSGVLVGGLIIGQFLLGQIQLTGLILSISIGGLAWLILYYQENAKEESLVEKLEVRDSIGIFQIALVGILGISILISWFLGTNYFMTTVLRGGITTALMGLGFIILPLVAVRLSTKALDYEARTYLPGE
ncbi:hypothetical protein MASR2M15_02410 [Anaerolineales bacterium]